MRENVFADHTALNYVKREENETREKLTESVNYLQRKRLCYKRKYYYLCIYYNTLFLLI